MQRVGRRMAAVRRRWHELVVKEALGTITAAEHAKLERYQVLVRYKPSADERRHEARMRYDTERLLKQARRYLHEAANSPTVGDLRHLPADKTQPEESND